MKYVVLSLSKTKLLGLLVIFFVCDINSLNAQSLNSSYLIIDYTLDQITFDSLDVSFVDGFCLNVQKENDAIRITGATYQSLDSLIVDLKAILKKRFFLFLKGTDLSTFPESVYSKHDSVNIIPFNDLNDQYLRSTAKSKEKLTIVYQNTEQESYQYKVTIPAESFSFQVRLVNEVGYWQIADTLKMEKESYNVLDSELIRAGLEINLNTGVRPNFVFFNHPLRGRYQYLINFISGSNYFTGDFPNLETKKVFWKHTPYATPKAFAFNLSQSKIQSFEPILPGFSFTPKIYETKLKGSSNYYEFTASYYDIEDELRAYYPFDENLKDITSNQLDGSGKLILFPPEKDNSNCLKVDRDSEVIMPDVEDFNFNDASFTISLWVKIKDQFVGHNQALFSSKKNGYSKALHLFIRGKNPYFGFYGNDTRADTVLAPETWYHLTWRYFKPTGEQSIYLNGERIAQEINHAPLNGTGPLYIGKSFTNRGYFEGYIDDLGIWNRALSNREIEIIATQDDVIRKGETFKNLWLFLAVGITLIAMAFIWKRRSKVNSTHDELSTNRNAIFLIGIMRVLDKNGNDTSELFTPRLREILGYIILKNLLDPNGAKDVDMIFDIWGEEMSKKVANNRSSHIKKLRRLLENLNGVTLVLSNGYWKLNLTSEVYCDVIDIYHSEKRNKNGSSSLEFVSEIGEIMADIQADWLNKVRSGL